jgi:iron(III) transport system substrate-binding protein
MQKRNPIMLAGLMALTLVLTACGGAKTTTPAPSGNAAAPAPAAKEENKLVIYTARNKEIYEDLVNKFTAKYPEYKGNVQVLGMGAQQVAERVTAEKANPQGDFWWGGTQQAFELAGKQDLLAAVTPSFASKIEARYKDPNGKWYGELLMPEIIAYNTDAIKPADAPKDWDDLLGAQYKGKILLRDVSPSGTMRTIFDSIIYRGFKTTQKPDQGYDWLKKLDANTKSFPSSPSDLYLKLGRQEGTVTVWNLQDIQLQKDKQNMPFGWVMPTSGAPVLVDGVGVIKGAKHPQAAMKFLEFLFTDENREYQAATNYQMSTIAVDPAKQPAWLKAITLKPMDVDWGVMGEHDKEWITYWEQNIKGKGGK